MQHIKFLKFYFWVMAILFPVAIWFDITDGDPLIIIDYFDYIFWAVAITGIFGYCYSKKILDKTFWKFFLPFIVIWDLYILYYVIINDPEILTDEYGWGFILAFSLLYLVLILPEYIAIYLYGYKNTNNT